MATLVSLILTWMAIWMRSSEISFVSRDNFYALDHDFSILWTRPIFDPSAVTVSTVFDFCGNGAAEVIYRDQDSLYIFNGPTGDVKFQVACS